MLGKPRSGRENSGRSGRRKAMLTLTQLNDMESVLYCHLERTILESIFVQKLSKEKAAAKALIIHLI